ncbi:9558_t:CDS:2 [Gigaspora margarita]|uniref:9558_t:CDS:1 n=1 Tax=Gigaspora margarita TaxID=4874 RepID=A0ABN7UH74_GIGMA|nr:9558_t:CDS:2 [Gigaspora margarita]
MDRVYIYINGEENVFSLSMEEKLDKIREKINMEVCTYFLNKNYEQISRDNEASTNLYEVSRLIDEDYYLHTKQIARNYNGRGQLNKKINGYKFKNGHVKIANKIAFNVNITKIELNFIDHTSEEVGKCELEFDVLCKKNCISLKDISCVRPWLSIFLGVSLEDSRKKLESNVTTQYSCKKWGKVELSIQKSNFSLTDSFKNDVIEALKKNNNKDKVAELIKITEDYGSFYSRRLVLGGAIFKEKNKEPIIIGGDSESYKNDSLKSWVKSLNDNKSWDIIEFDQINSIFDLLEDNLKQEILNALGYRILKAGTKEIPSNQANSNYVHSLAVQFAELDKVTNICNCYIFATILSKEDTNNDFSLQVEYINNYAPILKIQRFNLKECQEYPKIGWIVVGKPINFDFDKTEFPININSNFNCDVASFNTCQLMAPTSQSDSTIAVKANFNLKRQICHYVYEITDKNTPVNNDDVQQQSVPFC